MQDKKILYVVNELVKASSNELVLNLVKHTIANNYQAAVGYVKRDDGALSERIRDAGADLVDFSSGSPLQNIRRYIRQKQIDIVHTHVLRADVVGGLAARLARRPILISTKHNIGYVPTQAGWRQRNLLYWPAMYIPDRIVIVTDSVRQRILTLPFIPERRVVTIPNGIDIERYAAVTESPDIRASFGIAEDWLVLIYTGRLVGGKGLEELLDAMSLLKQEGLPVHLLIVGTGDLQSKLEANAAAAGLGEYVTFTGFRNDIPELLAAADIFVLPSYSEGLPLSLLEAMAARKTVVVTPVNGMAEVVRDNQNGVFVPVKDVQALAVALRRLLQDPATRERLGVAAQNYVRQHYSIAQMVLDYEQLYHDCMVERG